MNQRQENSLTMFKAVAALFQQTPITWNTSEPVAASYAIFQNLLSQIEATALQQEGNKTEGYTADKNQQKSLLVNKTYSLILKLRAFAKRNNNAVLRNAIDVSLSSLEKTSEQSLINICQIVHDKGRQHQTEAALYKVTEADLTELKALIDAYKPLTGFRDSVGDQMAVATDGLDSLFGQARETLDILDDEVEALIEDENFVAAYLESRKTTDRKAKAGGPAENPIV